MSSNMQQSLQTSLAAFLVERLGPDYGEEAVTASIVCLEWLRTNRPTIDEMTLTSAIVDWANLQGIEMTGGDVEGLSRAIMELQPGHFPCGARASGGTGGGDPAECNWPVCGCDPYASDVISALEESGTIPMPADVALAEADGMHEGDPNDYVRQVVLKLDAGPVREQITAIGSAIASIQAPMACKNCGCMDDPQTIRDKGFMTCCPERDMVPAQDLINALWKGLYEKQAAPVEVLRQGHPCDHFKRAPYSVATCANCGFYKSEHALGENS